ncbi:MAG: hypothetical protein ACM3SS_12690 [Rhodospirillaceae bacterium]
MHDKAHRQTYDEYPVALAALAPYGLAGYHELTHIGWQIAVFGTSQRKHVT